MFLVILRTRKIFENEMDENASGNNSIAGDVVRSRQPDVICSLSHHILWYIYM
jgi:hypothetical protein